MLQLLVVLDKWTQIIDEGGSLDCIYCDFKKAFDKVPHQRLLKKVGSYGIKGEILGWIKAFLSNTIQQVIVNGESSQYKDVTSGIPQGRVLGPLLFVIFINDLPDQVKSGIFLFANDTKIFRNMRYPEDQNIPQDDTDIMLKWADKWQLEFHSDKCVMSVNKKEETHHTYKMKDTEFKQVNQGKDIAVIVDDQLKFKYHMYEKIRKTNNIIGLIRRFFIHLDEEMLLKLYTGLVHPHIEYTNSVWCPTKMKDTIAVENVQ